MTDHFALFGEARRPWLDPAKLKAKYYRESLVRQPDAAMNEAFRVLSDPKLRLHHLLTLEGADLSAGRPVPPAVAELFWSSGTLLREVDRWLLRYAEASGALGRSLLKSEQVKLEKSLEKLDEQLRGAYGAQLEQLRGADAVWNSRLPNDLADLTQLYDSISYLTRLLERAGEKGFQLSAA